MYLLEFNGINKRYGNKDVLTALSLKIREGEIFGLIGKSGEGKTTLLKILIGMVKADKGEVYFEGSLLPEDPMYLRRKTGFSTQDNTLFEELNLVENSIYFGSLYGMKKKEIEANMKELLQLVELKGYENLLIKQISGGMKKRANLLVSLIHKPKLLVLDEPTVGLDPIIRNGIWEYIHKINQAGTTILVTSHILEEIEKNCSRIGILNKGDMIAVGTIEQYKASYPKAATLNEIFGEVLNKSP
ncbi:ABC transporter ATP-binding protein [Candidatus Pacearchaeota archaeon]|nr:ABC transporter ATP-binding protein [Candidatus Pacearchaeota archaeon]